MVIISQTKTKRRFFSTLRWRVALAFLAIMIVSFGVMVMLLSGMVSEHLYSQRIRQDSYSVEKLATGIAPLFQSAAADSLTEELNEAAGELGGRLILLDANGKVQVDTYALLNGARIQTPEVLSVLTAGKSSAYGIHRLQEGHFEFPAAGVGTTQVAYCAALVMGTRGPLGALLYVSSIDEMAASLEQFQMRALSVLGGTALVVLALSLLFSRVLTSPVISLTKTIQKMGRGDLSVRAPVTGSGELRDLARNYNQMAAQLENLDNSRNQFVSNASHELRTPLTSLKVMLESMLYQPDMPEELRTEFMTDMDHEIDRLTDIIQDLLALSRVDSGKGATLSISAVDAPELVRQTLRKLQPLLEGRTLDIQTQLPEQLTLQADASKLEQVFYNLIENAIKYTQDGGKIRISMQKDGKQMLFAVSDTGVGIPESDLQQVFERFYRVDKARSRETGGTGLGLSIVKQMVKLHGGEVTVESVLGEGSTFTVTLPLAAVAEGDGKA